MDKGVIENYQILTPSTWMASPKDPFGNPGPYEEAVAATPLLEDYEKPEDFKGWPLQTLNQRVVPLPGGG